MVAIAPFGKLKLSGFPAWAMWLLAHIYFLIGFHNRLVGMPDGAWAYCIQQRHARIVSGDDIRPSSRNSPTCKRPLAGPLPSTDLEDFTYAVANRPRIFFIAFAST